MEPLPKALFTAEQSRRLDQIAIVDYQQSDLMQRAGAFAFKCLKSQFVKPKKIAVFCGKGNNGGDGFVLAELANKEGIDIQLITMCDIKCLEGDALLAAQSCLSSGVRPQRFNEQLSIDSNCELIVDALLGTGINGQIKAPFAQAISLINEYPAPVIAIDMPSGLSSDTGVASKPCVIADLTVCLIALKQGFFTADAFDVSGQIMFSSLDLPEAVYAQVPSGTTRLDQRNLTELKRKNNSHKNTYGHVLVVGSDIGYLGACLLCGKSALMHGAGCVSIATHKDHANLPPVYCPELMSQGINHADQLLSLIDKATTIALGPGLVDSEFSNQIMEIAIMSHKTMVVDAGALRWLSNHPQKRDNWILTPHPGEAAVLLKTTSNDIQSNRYEAARSLQAQYGGVVILKGAGSIIQTSKYTYVCPYGNPHMATAGSGDLLTGICAAMLAQHHPIEKAAINACLIHAMAGDRAAKKLNAAESLLASAFIK